MKRSVAVVLCISIFLSAFIFQTPGAFASEKGVFISNNGGRISEIIIRQDEKEILTADTAGIDAVSYQWQLLLDVKNDLWVSVYDKTERDCEISYAVLQNLLDDANSSYIRCVVSDGSESFYSEAVCVGVAPVYEKDENAASFVKPEMIMSASPKAAPARAVRAASVESEYVTITIKYLDESSLGGVESAVYSPYTATIEKGTPFKQDVLSPTFLGFAPYYDKTGGTVIEDPASTVFLDIESVTENVEIKVYYKPIEVDFAIRYFFQNINDDLYTENVSLYFSGKEKTGTIIEDDFLRQHAGNTDGFEKMYHVPENIAADGSTVFECYYDRNYYLLQFDLDGGYGVEPIYARYGTPFFVNEPTKYGYQFVGWDMLFEDTDGDGIPDKGDEKAEENFPSTIGTKNMYFRALWKSVNTTYSRAYWVERSNGDLEYLGAIRTDAQSGTIVSGANDLKAKYKEIYPFQEHQHSEEDGCYGYCPYYKSHTHTLACYTTGTLNTADTAAGQNGTVKTVFEALTVKEQNPTEGYVYRYRYNRNNYYNFFYFGSTWYYLGTGTSNTVGGISHGGMSNLSQNNTYTSAAANMTCEASSHTHTAECISCTKLVHTHNETCNPDPRYYEFVRADQNVIVEGDGSSTVNIYYKPKEYTLRFYYARESDANGYQVVGGSTYYFGGGVGTANTENDTVESLLGKIPDGQWGKAEKPDSVFYDNKTLSGSTSDTSQYVTGSLKPENSQYTYYYFEFKAQYGDDISTKWPIGILAPVRMLEQHDHSYKYTDNDGVEHSATIDKAHDYLYAYFSAWNGEYKVKYTQDNMWIAGKGTKNETIKGRYMVLDENLLHDSQFDNNFENSTQINFVGFWDNGANIPWSVPKLFQYHLMLEVPATTVIDEISETVTENGVKVDNVKVITQDSEIVYNIPEGTRIFRKHFDKKTNDYVWYEQYQSYRAFDDSVVTSQTPTQISGFEYTESTWSRRENGYTSIMGEILKDAYDVFFYYSRNEYTLTYFNYENVLHTEFIPYNTPLTAEKFDAGVDAPFMRYPPSLEPDAYEFVGWYTSPMRIYPINFTTARMPSENIVWYAKWVPVKHQVNFFSSYDDMLSYENDKDPANLYKSFDDIEHGTLIGKNVENPTKTGDGGKDLIFVGWFYMENGEKKAFTPLDMRINRDMNIFADWSSSSPQPYLLRYEVDGKPGVKVADDTTGFAYAGSTRTFTAKAGYPYNQLYSEYNHGYFPTVSSSSITVQYEEDKNNPQLNVRTFTYVEAQNINYTVRYVNKSTGQLLEKETVRTTSNAVVTERFKAFPDMVPDAFYKRLVLAVEKDENGNYVGSKNNVITFYYTPNETSAYYAVHFMLEKLGTTEAEKSNYAIDGSGGYEESGTHVEGIGDIDSKVSIIPQEFAGFSLISDKAVSTTDGKTTIAAPYTGVQYSITVTKDGTELYIFYERLEYKYTVHYYEYGTTNPLKKSFEGVESYGTMITETAPDISGFTCVSDESKTIPIRDVEEQNVIIFYYAPIQYVVEYIAVPEDGGTLSRTIEVFMGGDSPEGSTATANAYYEFEGWYTDEACTIPATKEIGTISGNTLTPIKDKLSETGSNKFYAKFVRRAGDFTIIRQNPADDDQVFVYEVKNNATSETITVTVTGSSNVTIKDLPFGEYTVTQINQWSWRHDDPAVTKVEHQRAEGTTVQFSDPEKNDKWLNGNSELVRNQRGILNE